MQTRPSLYLVKYPATWSNTRVLRIHPLSLANMLLLLPLALSLLSRPLGVLGSNDCQPSTWPDPPERRDEDDNVNGSTIVMPKHLDSFQASTTLQPGDINCRGWGRTYDDAGYDTCTELSNNWGISLAWFFQINPTLLADCSNIEPNTFYCIDACKSDLVKPFSNREVSPN